MNFTIRAETDDDIPKITALTQVAFKDHIYSSHTEHLIINALRKANALSISLVAESENQLLGHIAFSPIEISDGSKSWFGLGPISVAPHSQNKGIGSALIRSGLRALRIQEAKGCVVLGEPEYYNRFGFRNIKAIALANTPPEYFMVLPFNTSPVRGLVAYHKAFSVQG
jgi:putative acetyltransferase